MSLTKIRVRYCETDAMGIVHHTSYINWLEQARIEWLDDIGCPYRELEKLGYFLPVIEVNLKYRKSVKFDDIVHVEAFLAQPPKARFKIGYKIKKETELIAEGSTVHTFINKQTKVVRAPDVFLERIGNGGRHGNNI